MSGPESTEVEEPFIDQPIRSQHDRLGWKHTSAGAMIFVRPVLDPVRPPQIPACGFFTLCRPEVR
jgi:hypothetical protein